MVLFGEDRVKKLNRERVKTKISNVEVKFFPGVSDDGPAKALIGANIFYDGEEFLLDAKMSYGLEHEEGEGWKNESLSIEVDKFLGKKRGNKDMSQANIDEIRDILLDAFGAYQEDLFKSAAYEFLLSDLKGESTNKPERIYRVGNNNEIVREIAKIVDSAIEFDLDVGLLLPEEKDKENLKKSKRSSLRP